MKKNKGNQMASLLILYYKNYYLDVSTPLPGV